MRGQRPTAQQRIERFAERKVVDISGRRRLLALCILVIQAKRLHRPRRRHRRLEHIRVKGQQRPPVGRRAFRKHAHQFAGREPVRQFLHDAFRFAALLALNEHGAQLLREPADHRPFADFRLRHERRRPPRVDHVDVDPRNVVADHERALVEARVIVMHDQAHAGEPQKLQRPRPVEFETLLRGRVRKTRRDGPHAMQQVDDESYLAERELHRGCLPCALRQRCSNATWPDTTVARTRAGSS